MKCRFTKARFRLKCPGLADNASQISSKTNCLLRRLFLFNKTKNIQTRINTSYIKQSVLAKSGLFGDTIIANIHIELPECENKEKYMEENSIW